MEAAAGIRGDDDLGDRIAQEFVQGPVYAERLQGRIVLSHQIELLAITDYNLLPVRVFSISVREHILNLKRCGNNPVPLFLPRIEMENVLLLPTPRIIFRVHTVLKMLNGVIRPVPPGGGSAPRRGDGMVVAEKSHTGAGITGKMAEVVVRGCRDVTV